MLAFERSDFLTARPGDRLAYDAMVSPITEHARSDGFEPMVHKSGLDEDEETPVEQGHLADAVDQDDEQEHVLRYLKVKLAPQIFRFIAATLGADPEKLADSAGEPARPGPVAAAGPTAAALTRGDNPPESNLTPPPKLMPAGADPVEPAGRKAYEQNVGAADARFPDLGRIRVDTYGIPIERPKPVHSAEYDELFPDAGRIRKV